MKINFVVPGNLLSGGHRIIYELANRLALAPHSVSIQHPIFPAFLGKHGGRLSNLKRLARSVPKQLLAGQPRWMQLDVPVTKVPWLAAFWTRWADIVIVTHWDVAWATRGFSPMGGKIIYYIHDHYRAFGDHAEFVRKTWELPFFRIVTTRRLQREAHQLGLQAEYVPNAIDARSFCIMVPPEERDPLTLAMLYSNDRRKGIEDGLRALDRVYENHPNLRVILFGTARFKHTLRPWMEWRSAVSHRELLEIYNRASIFLCPSHYEGWGLPGFESMACGCALVSTQHDGVEEYAEHGVTALLARIGDVEALASHIEELIADSALRLRLAHQAREAAQCFPWEKTVRLFESALAEASRASAC
jgi:glycosyltransferase involved in cell wall biosynthesis